jgi:hypothetical protein
MAKSKIVSVPMSNHQKLIEMSYLVKDKKAKKSHFCMDEFYFEIFDEVVAPKKKT